MLVPGRPSCDVLFSELERWPEPGLEVQAGRLAVAGGGHLNTAAALARLGVRVALAGVVGDDAFGDLVLRDARSEQLPVEHLRVVPGLPTPVSVALNAGDRGFVTYAPGWDEAAELVAEQAEALLAAGRVDHVHGDLGGQTPRLVAAARAAGATYSVDAHEPGPWLAGEHVRGIASSVDLLFANEAEALAITGADDWESALDRLAERTPHVVVKLGAAGAACAVDGEVHVAPAPAVEAVDSTGAGDCFAAGYLWALRSGRDPAAALVVANRCGAAAVTELGGFRGALRLEQVLA